MPNYCHIIWHDTLDSTNREAARLIRAGLDADKMTIVAAKSQTAGRGQGDHLWHSAAGENLTFSAAVHFAPGGMKARDQQALNGIVLPVICNFLRKNGVEPRIKLPNDVYVDARKICGILVENILMGDDLVWTIIGIGLNLNEMHFPADLPDAVSLRQLTGVKYSPEGTLDELAGGLRVSFREYLQEELGSDIP